AFAVARECLTLVRDLRDKFAFVYVMVPLAAAAVLNRDDAWAARILGAADAISERTGAAVTDGTVLHLRREAERQARARLGPHRWLRSHSGGRAISLDSFIKDIDQGRVAPGAPRPTPPQS